MYLTVLNILSLSNFINYYSWTGIEPEIRSTFLIILIARGFS